MEVSAVLSHEVSDLCIGKPALRSLPSAATVGDALVALKEDGESHLVVWVDAYGDYNSSPERRACAGKVCMVDVLCFLCDEANIAEPAAALGRPVAALLSKGDDALVRLVEPHSSVLEALDVILDGAHNLVVPIRATGGSRKKLAGGGPQEFCWLTQEDFVRFFLNSIGLFSPAPSLSVSALGLVRPDPPAVRPGDPALSALPLLRRALADHASVAVVAYDGRLIGEISPSTLALCDERAAPALAALSAAELMSYVDCSVAPPESLLRSIKAKLNEKGLVGMLELLEADFSPPVSSSSSSSASSWSSSASSSSDEEFGGGGGGARPAPGITRLRSSGRSGSYSARMGRRSEEAIVCHPGSSLMAVMVQALAHRVSYVWVVDEEYMLVGFVAFSDMLRVFREQLQQPLEREQQH